MALDWLGQLSPTMQQQIALQRVLLALQREDEQIRARTAERQPALARGLGGGAPVMPYAGPTLTLAGEKKEPSVTPSHFRPGAGSLEEALRAATPATGGAIDIQGEAWAKRKEMIEGRVVSAKEAYDKIITLDPTGQKTALNALRKYKSDVYMAMEKEGYLSPAGELVQPAKEKVLALQRVDSYSGEVINVYADGTEERTGHFEKLPEPEAAVGPTISEAIGLEKLGMEQVEFGERHQKEILDVLGPMPKIGIDTVTEDGKDIPVEQRHVNAWLEGYGLLNALLSTKAGETAPEGEVSMSSVKAQFEGRPDLIGDVQDRLGIPRTEVWDEETERQFSLYGDIDMRGVEGEPTGEGKPKFERQKKFWDAWLKTWGKVFKKRGSVNIAGETYEEWKAKKGGK